MTKKSNPDVKNELALLETKHRDDVFKSTISTERIKEFSVIIYQCIQQGGDTKFISEITSLSPSQIEHIKQQPEYYQAMHNLIDNDSHITQALLRNHKVRATQALIEKVDEGNMKAITEYFRLCDKEEQSNDSLETMWAALLTKFGVMTNNQKNTKKLKDAEDVIEVDIVQKQLEDFSDETDDEYRARVLKNLMSKDS